MRNVEYITNGFGAAPQGLGGWTDILEQFRPSVVAPKPPIPQSIYTKEQLRLRGGTDFPRAFPPAPPSDYAVLQAFNDQQLVDPIASAGLQTYKSRGIAGIDQSINFFQALLEGFQAYGKSSAWTASLNRMGLQNAVLDAFIKVFNTAASRFGANPLTNSIRDAILKQIRQDVENAKMVFYSLPFIYSALVDVRKRLAR